MIHVFFVPGMFGSTIEYVLRNFTNEHTPLNVEIASDGSMHTFAKMNHPLSMDALDNTHQREINTPIYPFEEAHLAEILTSYPTNDHDHCILIYAKSFEDAERNLLFQYHKISQGIGHGLKIFHGSPANAKNDVTRWNPNYSNYKDLTPWEFREWFSIFYPSWIQEWQDSCNQVPDTWFKISTDDILYNSKNTFEDVITFCNLNKKSELDDFVSRWQQAQKYILDEYTIINNIVNYTINKQEYTWKPLHIIAESIIQKKLRDNGFEIRCDGLDIFPTNSMDLYNLLDRNLLLHQV
jgi:hypothetical protein